MMSDNAQRAPRSAEMTAMVLRTDRSIGLERRPVPTPRDDQVLVTIDLCGICGSDLHASKTPEVYLGGFIMGHEPVGRIARVGRDVPGWHVGQRVCINPNGDTFRVWVNDVAPPKVRLLTASVRAGQPVKLAVTDAGSGVDPQSITASVGSLRPSLTL